MSAAADDRDMAESRSSAEVEALIREIERYLRYLDALREGRPPRQGPEPPPEKPPA